MSTPFKSLAAALPRTAELEYVPPLVNPLTVDAGHDQQISALSGILDGDASSYSSSDIVVSWALISGPGTATLGSPSEYDTTVTVSEGGVYVFRLTATQGEWENYDESTITFTP